jgi:Fervidolysin N-terminal prodomain
MLAGCSKTENEYKNSANFKIMKDRKKAEDSKWDMKQKKDEELNRELEKNIADDIAKAEADELKKKLNKTKKLSKKKGINKNKNQSSRTLVKNSKTVKNSNKDRFIDYKRDPTIYSGKGTGKTIELGKNKTEDRQIVLRMKKNHTKSQLKKAVASINGKIIGQIPPMNIYQIQIPKSGMKAINLSIKIIKRQKGVANAIPNVHAKKLSWGARKE